MIKKYLNRLFIDGLSGMASGLFATLIIGTIISQIAKLFGDNIIGPYLVSVGMLAKTITGAGIGIGVAVKLKASPLTTVSAAVAGMVGAFPHLFQQAPTIELKIPGDPLGAFIAAYIAIEIGGLISGKTKLEIVLTPLCCILSGATVSYLVGPYLSAAMNWFGNLININVEQHPIIGGIIVSVAMGICLTLPISSAALGYIMNLSGLAAGAAVVGCCCNMIGFAVASFRENKVSGLVSQGIGTSMIQMPNIVKKPLIWLPAILSSAILGPVATTIFKLQSTNIGSGMGTAGLIGPIETYFEMVKTGTSSVVALIEVIVILIVLPAVLAFFISEAMRKLKWIKPGDMRLDT